MQRDRHRIAAHADQSHMAPLLSALTVASLANARMQSRPEIIGSDGGGIEALLYGAKVAASLPGIAL